jgi:hypothetical protein
LPNWRRIAKVGNLSGACQEGNIMNPFEEFLTDTLTLRKADGTVHTDIKAAVDSREIGIFDISLQIEPGDRFIRVLPNGQTEEFIVEDAVFSQAFHAIPAQWTVRYWRGNQPAKPPQSVTYNVSGPNSRINVHSLDRSTNIVHSDSQKVFSELRETVISHLASEGVRDRLLERIEEMERTHGTSGFLPRYQEFIAAAANHMTVIAPFLPALAHMLSMQVAG